MEPKTKRSITDHFTIVPKEKKKEVKIHPLFTKKAEKKNVLPIPLPPPPPTQLPQKQELPKKVPIKKPVRKLKNKLTRKPKTKKQLDQYDATIDTRGFFKRQKQARESKRPTTLEPYQPSPETLDIQSIEELMNKNFPRWQKNSCCKLLFDSMMFRANDKILWCDKYRPDQVDGLLGYLPDFQYLRDWLETLKIRSDKKNVGALAGEGDPYNLVLLVGHHGIGKTATVYTAAKETGYTVFEINTSSRRAGKDVIKQVGEMTASHLVRFDHQKKKRKQGETIIIRDTVKKSKKIDIATHFKRMLTMSAEKDVTMDELNTAGDTVEESVPAVEDVMMDEVKPANNTITSFFKRSVQITPTLNSVIDDVKPVENMITAFFNRPGKTAPVLDVVMDDVEPGDNSNTAFFKKPGQITTAKSTIAESNILIAESNAVATEPICVTTKSINEAEVEPTKEQINVKDEHKQSLVLLEEVDLLFEEDKGFWPAVIELCQKSKRPIIMTCNGMTKNIEMSKDQ